MKRKIGLFLSEEPSEGGKFQYSLSLIEALAAFSDQSYEITICYKNRVWTEYLKENSFKCIHVPFNYLDRILKRAWETTHFPPRLMRQVSPHIHSVARTIMSQKRDLWIFPNHEDFTYQIPVRSLATVHDLMHRYEPRFPEVSASGLYKKREWVLRNICQWSRALLVDSNIGKKQLVESYRVAPEKVFILPYIAPKYIYAMPDEDEFIKKYNVPAKYIFYPAQFWKHKNHEGLINAFISLKNRISDLHLVFVGSPKNNYQVLYELVENCKLTKNVLFLGYVPNKDMPEFYRRARAMVMPTFFGPTNIPPLEAMALGCPVAVSDIYGMREQLGNAAIYFNPLSVQEIASVIELLWNDDTLCAELSKKDLERSKNWNQNQFSISLKNVIDSLINSSKSDQ